MDTRGGKGGESGATERVTRTLTLACVKQIAVGSCCVTQGTQTRFRKSWRAGMGRAVGGASGGGGHMSTFTASC